VLNQTSSDPAETWTELLELWVSVSVVAVAESLRDRALSVGRKRQKKKTKANRNATAIASSFFFTASILLGRWPIAEQNPVR